MDRLNLPVFTLCCITFALVMAFTAYSDTNGVWDRAEDIRPGTFGADEGGGNYSFPNSVDVSNNLVIGNGLGIGGFAPNAQNKLMVNGSVGISGLFYANSIRSFSSSILNIYPNTIFSGTVNANVTVSNSVYTNSIVATGGDLVIYLN